MQYEELDFLERGDAAAALASKDWQSICHPLRW